MDWIERLLHVSLDGRNGSLELLYILLPLAGFVIGSAWVLWFRHDRKKREARAISLVPDDLGIASMEVRRFHVEGDESDIPFAFETDLLRQVKLAAEKRGTNTRDWLSKAAIRADDPVTWSEIEKRYGRRRSIERQESEEA